MNILYAMRTNYAGLAYHYTEYVNSKTSHHAKAYVRKLRRFDAPNDVYTGAWYSPELTPLVHDDELQSALKWADVVHCFYGESPWTLGATKWRKQKRMVYSWIGQSCSWDHLARMFPDGVPQDGSVVITHNAQGQDQYEPYIQVGRQTPVVRAPTLIDVLHPRMAPIPYGEKLRHVGMFVRLKKSPNLPDFHTEIMPGSATRIWSDKGMARVRESLDGFEFACNDENMPWYDILNLRRTCWIGVDELISPSWNTSAIEFLAVGTPVLNDVNDYTVACLRDVLGAPNPFIVCNWKTIRSKVEWYYALDDAARAQMCRDARAWAETYYNPAKVWARHEELYEHGR